MFVRFTPDFFVISPTWAFPSSRRVSYTFASVWDRPRFCNAFVFILFYCFCVL